MRGVLLSNALPILAAILFLFAPGASAVPLTFELTEGEADISSLGGGGMVASNPDEGFQMSTRFGFGLDSFTSTILRPVVTARPSQRENGTRAHL